MHAWIIAAVLFGMVVLTDDSYEQAVNEAEHYRYMVCNGFQPDYDDRRPDCSNFVPDVEYSRVR